MGEPFKGQNVRWYDAEGRRVKPNTQGARKEITDTSRYYGFVTYEDGTRKKYKLFTDLQSSRSKLNELQHKANRRDAGLDDEEMEHAKRPLAEHIQGWKEHLDARPITQERRELMVQRMNKLIGASRWKRVGDITEDSFLVAVNKLKVSAQTRNHYLRHIKQFIKWCIRNGRLGADPLAGLSAENVQVDRRHDRRALTLDEQTRLLATTEASQVLYGEGDETMDGPTRALLYEMALTTGLRRKELKSLTRDSFDLEEGTVVLAARFSKNRRRHKLKLTPSVIERLRKWFAAGRPLWNNLTQHSSKMLRPDLKAAGIPYVTTDADGRKLYADFHALRHTFCTAVAEAGARLGTSIKDQMRMTRHTSVDLYMRVYVKENPENVERIAAALPDLRTPAVQKAVG